MRSGCGPSAPVVSRPRSTPASTGAGCPCCRRTSCSAAPDASTLFDDRVYKRGALFLHTLRATYGDAQFFSMLRQWLEVHRYGTVSTDDFVALALTRLGPGVSALAKAWLYEPALPPLPTALRQTRAGW